MQNTSDPPNSDEEDSTDDEWERGDLGRSGEHAERVPREREDHLNDMIDEALDLKMISIRLQEGLIEALKVLAERKGIGYQPLIRQILTEHVRSADEAGVSEEE